MKTFLQNIPKVELHLYIEGSLEPKMMFDLARKNNITLKYKSEEEIKKAYDFSNLQDFLDIYYQGANVLQTKQDFYDLTFAYMKKCKEQNVVHTEIFFDPQTHTARNIPLKDVIEGIWEALQKAKSEFGISSFLIACILRHLSEDEGLKTLDELCLYKDKIKAIGLDSSELNNPPFKFKNLFQKAKEEGFLLVMHAGEEGSSEYIKQALKLSVSRIDHGVRCEEDLELVKQLAKSQIPLTMCPLSNIKLKVFNTMQEHNILKLLRQNLCVCVNSDDPAYFGGYILENFNALDKAFKLSKDEVRKLCINAINASFLQENEKESLRKMIEEFS
ncbi:adenosine deaminase [Campylobacter lari]|uniref:adenosine deaminase n=1 Tax=Campylobacter lari TaxID=201 RepID=UPI0013885806|nr:adenosine deaminase [Campylobacter lari]EAI4429217.1 adenosine deaminase [Campylobacter lari]EAI5529852.1 adenosine deaminase [Campylobacter lari]EGK1190723.1 adenosine deaminase [Campylobacter lari]MBT0816978.1 adenosine deaminase [Campylobacter lari]MCR2079674.1 adenosine deaminase [Campylobacter lari subsp. concheus]